MDEKIKQFLSDLPEIELTGPFFGGNQDIATLREIGFVQSVELSDEPLDPVPGDCVSRFPAGGDPQPRKARLVFAEGDRKVRRMVPFPLAICVDKIASIQYPLTLGERESAHTHGSQGPGMTPKR